MTTRRPTPVPIPIGCENCESKDWLCISCGTKISTRAFHRYVDTSVAILCECCDHSYVCRKCYALTPDFKVWNEVFGEEHSIINLMSNDEIDPIINILADFLSDMY
jgi:hypothetical protein